MSDAVGTSQFEVLRKIARGGMGEVYLARHMGIAGFSKEVVIKQIHETYADDPEFVTMFLQEARIAALLDHPNIVQIFELGQRDNSYFIVMEYVEGLSLSRLLRAGGGRQLPIPVAIQIASGVAEGLSFAHNKRDHRDEPLNLVHRDISPPNILLSTAGIVKITDFGIAKIRWSVTQTQAGTVKGKHWYLSPEQARGEKADRRADIFSLGLVLYEMTVGQRAYCQGNDTDVLLAAASGNVPPPTSLIADYPADLEQVVMRALAKRRGGRYTDCQQLQEALLALLVSRNLVASPSRLGTYVQEMMQREAQARISSVQDVNTRREPTAEKDLGDATMQQTLVLSRTGQALMDGPQTDVEPRDTQDVLHDTDESLEEVATEVDTRLPPLMKETEISGRLKRVKSITERVPQARPPGLVPWLIVLGGALAAAGLITWLALT